MMLVIFKIHLESIKENKINIFKCIIKSKGASLTNDIFLIF